MKKIRIAALFTITALLFTMIHMTVSAQPPTEVYTAFSSGNFNHSGNGTAASPYNLFEDALAAVADGGTIYIGAGGAFINYTDNAPLAIEKNITIAAAPNLGYRPTLESRTPGIILGADVTFENIVLSFSNGYRPIVCANGYALTMDNTSYYGNTRIIHLSGGSMHGYSNVAPGQHSRITVRGKNSQFGNIYAGSINGSFDGDVDITVENVSGKNIGTIYSCGALEGIYNSDNFMDPDNEPDFPTENSKNCPVTGSVSVELSHTGIRAVYGTTGGNGKTDVTVSTDNLYSCSLNDIDSLTVTAGTFQPSTINNGADITVQNGAAFDISDIASLEVNHFFGGGILVINPYGLLTINGICTGETEFRTAGGGQNNSYFVQPEHMYIKTNAGNGTFTFHPYYTQQGMTFDKHADGWYTSAQPETELDVLTNFTFREDVVLVTEANINEFGVNIELVSEFTESSPFRELSFIPFHYEIGYKGNYFYAESELYEEQYYEGNLKELNINLSPASEDSVYISRMSEIYGWLDHISAGVYDIVISAPTEEGNLTRLLRLVILEDGAEQEEFIVTDTQGNIRATYTNIAGNDIEHAKMIAAVYENEVMKKIEISKDIANIPQGSRQTFCFDVSDTEYDNIKIFLWDNMHGMKPLCNNYTSSTDDNNRE